MHITSINVGKQKNIQIGNKEVTTGIFKYPVEERVTINTDGIIGDVVADTKHHGGKDQAVYLYSEEDYIWWAKELHREMPFGLLGENLTISSFGNEPLRVGDCLRINTILLEITFPRIPCAKLGVKMGDAAFVKHFVQARRPGFYTRVLETGDAQVGDKVEILPSSQNFPTVTELYDLWHNPERDQALLNRGLEASIAERARSVFEFWLEHS
ncbi:MAG: MOSC domain-containing protein [Scytonematopsis contorta HA4267-MV1]|jgi:MOSC domain-containing protein YiiM|nr:MOSC domain-containing protein [Scytonematopsis contorta HA4267-MV1]